MNRMRLGVAAMGLVAILVASPSEQQVRQTGREASAARPARINTVIMFAADGMRPDLVQKYADAKVMKTMGKLLKTGVAGPERPDPGASRPTPGVGWSTLATGTWPGEHGSTNNTFHRVGEGNVQQPDVVRDERDPSGRHDCAGG